MTMTPEQERGQKLLDEYDVSCQWVRSLGLRIRTLKSELDRLGSSARYDDAKPANSSFGSGEYALIARIDQIQEMEKQKETLEQRCQDLLSFVDASLTPEEAFVVRHKHEHRMTFQGIGILNGTSQSQAYRVYWKALGRLGELIP